MIRRLCFVLALAFVAVLVLAHQARAQSALAFYQGQTASGADVSPATRKGVFKPTGRRVTTALPAPPPFVRGRLVCAVNVNRYLARMGKTPTGSAAAKSFIGHGRKADRYTPGAVQVSLRKGGGHAEIVAGGGRCWNPSASGQRWVLVPCASRRNVIGWWLA
jgi:hypothetical protein